MNVGSSIFNVPFRYGYTIVTFILCPLWLSHFAFMQTNWVKPTHMLYANEIFNWKMAGLYVGSQPLFLWVFFFFCFWSVIDSMMRKLSILCTVYTYTCTCRMIALHIYIHNVFFFFFLLWKRFYFHKYLFYIRRLSFITTRKIFS